MGMKGSLSPVQKVVELLGALKEKTILLHKEEAATFAELMEWCKDSKYAREGSLKDNRREEKESKALVEQADATIQENSAQISEVSNMLSVFEKDMKTAAVIRKAENSDFLANEKEMVETVETMERAYTILKKGMHSPTASPTALAQVRRRLFSAVTVLERVVHASALQTASRTRLESFLQQSDESQGDDDLLQPAAKAYENKSGGILKVLQDLQEEADRALVTAREEEMKAKHNFELLRESLKNEIKKSISTIDECKRNKQMSTQKKAEMEAKGASLTKAISEDSRALKDVHQECQSKAEVWEEGKKEHAAEMQVIDKAVAILLKGTAASEGSGSESFLQVRAALKRMPRTLDGGRVTAAAKYLQTLAKTVSSTLLTQIASRVSQTGRSGSPFASVVRLINDMIEKLSTQINEDADEKAWCDSEVKKSTEKTDKKRGRVDILTNRMEQATASMQLLKNKINKLQKQIVELQKNMKEDSAIRSREHSQYEKAVKESSEAATACADAMQVLREYYQSSDAEEDESSQSFVQRDEGGMQGIIGLLEVAESDFSKSEADARAAEEAGSREFKISSQESRESIAEKQMLIQGKEAEIKQLQSVRVAAADDLEGEHEELDAITLYFDKVKQQCTTKAPTFEEIQGRRQKEIDGLQQALDILTAPASQG